MRAGACRLAQSPGALRLPGVARHAETCLRCQAEAARIRRLRRDLRRLAVHREPAPDSVAAEVERAIAGAAVAAEPSPTSSGIVGRAAAAGAVAATAAGAAAVVLWRRGHSLV